MSGPAGGSGGSGGAPRRGPGGGGPGPGGMHGAMLAPVAKPTDFRGSFGRLMGELRPERGWVIAVVLLAIVSVVLAVIGPKLLANATNVIFAGAVGAQMPAGITVDQAVAALQAQGQDNQAEMIANMPYLVPGEGIDFEQLAQWLGLASIVYMASSVFAWAQSYIMAGVTQRTVYRLRERVDKKLGRLPLAYFDRESRGDILSRVTNDIDNISQTLQQSLTQLITSLFTVIGVLIMMLTISPLLALVSVLVVPASMVVAMVIAKRSQVQFAAQWERTGNLNGHIEICDNVNIAATANVHSSISVPGTYASAVFLALPHDQWRRRQFIVQRLPELAQRVRRLEEGGGKAAEDVPDETKGEP